MLESINKYYEVAVFTASHKWYADVILDYIDPKGVLFQHRFYRESCIKTTDNVYVKDLRVIQNVPMKDMMIVDNAIYSFGA
jgi:TFIIF-interacting CTD phosphatase-like protein